LFFDELADATRLLRSNSKTPSLNWWLSVL